MSNAVCWLPTRLCVYYPLECQVLHWIRSFSLRHDQFFCAGGNGQGSIDEFSETAAICLNKALFSIPRILARRPSSQPVPPGASFPVVPACLHTGSWKAWQQPHPGVFLSRMNKSSSELKGRSQRKALSLNGVGKVEIAQSFLFFRLPVEHWTIGTGGSGGSSLKRL